MGKFDKGEVLKQDVFVEIEDFFSGKFTDVSHKGFKPLSNIYEVDDKIIVEMELAGLLKEDIFVEYRDRNLDVKGNKKNRYDNKVLFHRLERNYGNFERNFFIPDDIDEEKIELEFVNGLLVITLLKIDKK